MEERADQLARRLLQKTEQGFGMMQAWLDERLGGMEDKFRSMEDMYMDLRERLDGKLDALDTRQSQLEASRRYFQKYLGRMGLFLYSHGSLLLQCHPVVPRMQKMKMKICYLTLN